VAPDATTDNARYRWWVLANVVLVNVVVTGVSWNYVIMLAPQVTADLRGSLGWGTLWSGIALGVMLFSVPAGAIGDRLGIRRALGGGLVLAGASLLLRALAADSVLMLLTMIAFGLALALWLSNFPKALGEWFPPDELGLANGLAQAGVGIGLAAATSLTPVLVEPVGGWRSLTQGLGLAVLVLATVWLLTVRDRGADTAEPGSAGGAALLESIGRVARVRDVQLVSLCYLLYVGGYLAFLGYVPTYLTTVRGMSGEAAGASLALGPLAFIVGSLALPALSDRLGLRRAVYLPGMLVGGVALFAVVWALGVPLWLAFAALGFGTGVIALLFVIPVELPDVGPALAGSAVGVATTAGFLGGSLSPLILTPVAESIPVLAFGIWAGCFAISALLILAVRETGPRRAAPDSALRER
jgi:nitrate/nitrite transporter NarK